MEKKILGYHEPESLGKKGSFRIYKNGRITKYLGRHSLGHIEQPMVKGLTKEIEMQFPAIAEDGIQVISVMTFTQAYECARLIKEELNDAF